MKNSLNTIYKSLIVFLITIGASVNLLAQSDQNEKDILDPKKPVEATFSVEGVCGMCKRRIEEAADLKGVRFAEWNIETKMMKVVYVPAKISQSEIEKKIAAIGHDTKSEKASDKAYAQLHGCCKYRSGSAKSCDK